MPEVVAGFTGAPRSVYSDDYLRDFAIDGEIGFKLEAAPIFPMILSALIPNTGVVHRVYEILALCSWGYRSYA